VQVGPEAVHAPGIDRVAATADRERTLAFLLPRLLGRLRRTRARAQQQAAQQHQQPARQPHYIAG